MASATAFPIRTNLTAAELASRVAIAHAHYLYRCCEPMVDNTATDAALFVYCDCLAELAALEAAAPADIWAKATALETCLVHNVGQPSTIEGDCGLAVSLLRDLRQNAIRDQDVGSARGASRLIKEPICRTVLSHKQQQAGKRGTLKTFVDAKMQAHSARIIVEAEMNTQ